MQRHNFELPSLNVPSEVTYVGEDDSEFFTQIHGRNVNTINQRYMLPADADEIRVSLIIK